jgi:hypothetical protein
MQRIQHKNQRFPASSVTDNGIGYRISGNVRDRFENEEPQPIPFDQTAKSAFAQGQPVIKPYRPVSMSEVHRARDGTVWEWKPRVTDIAPRGTCACSMCGEQFVPKRSDAKTCSSRCRSKAYRVRSAGAQA